MGINWAGVGLLAGLYGADQGVKIGRDYINTELSKKLQANAARLNYDYSIKSAKNMPNATRTGLENAGYNPMLAVQNSTSGANSSWTSSGSLSSHSGDSLSNAFSSVQDIQRLENETKSAESQVKANEATAENQASQAMNNIEENKYIGDKRKAEISNITGNTALMEAQIDNMKKQIELGQMGITVDQEANAISAIGKEEYADKAKRYKEWGEKHPYLRNIDESITRYFNGVGGNVGATKKFK